MPSETERLTDPVWQAWGPYVADRQWGTVREDYSPDGKAWDYFPFQQSHLRAYRWGEDGLAGVSDRKQRLCLAVALWNGRDPILKERLFGLTNEQGNHGEDPKELYYHLDATLTHSYLKFLYKYPQAAFPYAKLYEENKRRTRLDPEYELFDTGVFAEDRYFDVVIEYAKASPTDILLRVTAHNRGPDVAPLHVLPTVWFRNTWSWAAEAVKPHIKDIGGRGVNCAHPAWDDYRCWFEPGAELLFCDNETNALKLFAVPKAGFFKDAIGEHVIRGTPGAVNPLKIGSKAAGHYKFGVGPGKSVSVRARLRANSEPPMPEPFADFDAVFARRIRDADQFHANLAKDVPGDDGKLVHRRAVAGLIWTKQYYEYDVYRWVQGDPVPPRPPTERQTGRNSDWDHLATADVLSMPDKWEYPWFAAWDSAFHCVPFAEFDPRFAKDQLLLFLREHYMHPNGQLPAYEWNFGDANPPVHAWACWRVFQIDRRNSGGPGDVHFLERAFHKLMINFTWWVNRKDAYGRNVFQGGFLGLDNIGVFDRSRPLPTGGFINQADATAWMGMYALNLMRIALELSLSNDAYEDIAIKFFEHFLAIASAMTNMAGKGIGLWDEADGFYYDELILPGGQIVPLRVRSLVGLIPLFAVEVLEPELLARVPAFAARLREVLDTRPDLAALVSRWYEPGRGERRLLSLLRGHRMKALLSRVLDPNEFLSDFGVRSLSKFHAENPYTFRVNGEVLTVDYQPAEANIANFGGNSNWRGPVWLPMNYLIIESLHKFHHYYGPDFKIETPAGSGNFGTILDAANEVSARVTKLFLKDSSGFRPALGGEPKLNLDPHFQGCLPFAEYFHADTGFGLGAQHQCGWTALVMKLLRNSDSVFADLCPGPHK